ncbi:hypothetical protein BN7_1184 [Wickerhamomyces ciferrii]|uniref:Glutamyl-tRNA(Gln) amidotransferase subunit A, mitochondrial n=1 Tax=Wickerhamomyces ciferrii (strain ATCC 14091 / BCRC 22168 / CBS 111 / JCM 3599 / NBRC 0793 / NRRL Y-1031 F-60-10) TaxID=1206466 RepID=K0KKJ9_WICCF|nr:uncharacterized protein BN7_1184 [Wickerhamomyces ciferrii]CCH41643.1 hypothetical protein BN7_1184 [Wickerhamomyces ciferrii]
MSTIASRIPEILKHAIAQNEKYNIYTSIRSQDQITIPKISNSSQLLSNKIAAIKDNIATIEEPTTCSSKMLAKYTSPYEATVMTLLNKAGAITIGKTNLDEFGMGGGTTNSYFGSTINPTIKNAVEPYTAGGSSGGSAAAIAADTADFALGTDTGGSVRVPGAYTGVFGFKPSYGRISRWGVVAYAQSLDTVGILAKDVDLVRNVYDVLNQYDSKDPTSLSQEIRNKIEDSTHLRDRSIDKLRIGLINQLGANDLSPDVKEIWQKMLSTVQDHHHLIPVSIPILKYALPAYYTLAPAEAASNLSRFDGIRYGYRSDDDKNNYAKTRTEGFGKEVKTRITLGNFNLNADSFKNSFLKAQNVRLAMKSQFNSIFALPNSLTNSSAPKNGVDILIAPVSMSTPPTLKKYMSESSIEAYANDMFVTPASLCGLPAISVPWESTSGNPVGIQIIGQYGDDKKVLEVAKHLKELNKI